MLTEHDKAFLQLWKTRNFDTWNEADVREDFVAPLLRCLGYAKDTVNGIVREKNLNLQATYHRIGRKEIAIDYIPTLRLKKFWIIEAKPGSAKKMQYGDLLQAHFYAIHPEVQARYIVMTNGWEIRIYDAMNCASWDDTLLICSQQDCEATFVKLKEFLSASQMLAAIRRHILSTIEESLQVEVDETILARLNSDIGAIIQRCRPLIKENARSLRRDAWLKAEAEELREIQSAEFRHLLIMMDIQTHTRLVYGREIVRRFLEASDEDRQKMADKLAMTYRGRPHSVFRVHCADAFARLLVEGIEVKKSNYVHSIVKCLDELVSSNMSYWEFSDLSNALVHLDNTTLRVAKKFAMRFMMKPIEKLVQSERTTLSPEDLLVNNPSVAKHMIPATTITAERLWRKYEGATSADGVWKGIWELEAIEEILDRIPSPRYPGLAHRPVEI